MLRKITSIILLASFIALASSGLMMMFMDSFEFQLRMHPVHKLFGIAMVISGITHAILNFKAIKKYLQLKSILLVGIVLTAFMVLLYFAGFKKPIDKEMINQIETVLSQPNDKE